MMSVSLRTTGMIQRADTAELDVIARFDVWDSVAQVQDHQISIAANTSYTVTGFSSIREVTVVVEHTLVNVVANAGNGAFTVPVDKMLALRGVNFTSLQISNPGTSAVDVRLIVGG